MSKIDQCDICHQADGEPMVIVQFVFKIPQDEGGPQRVELDIHEDCDDDLSVSDLLKMARGKLP